MSACYHRRGAMNLALFDFDGTITRSDTWTPFLRYSATRPRLVAASVLFAPLAVGYKLGWIAARTSRPIVARLAFGGRRAADVHALGRQYAHEVLPAVVHPHALERIGWHKQRGDTVVVVSASLDAYVIPWCEAVGVAAICTELEARDARLTGRYAGGECSGAAKVTRVRQRYDLGRYPIVYAYGDTDEDREMLAIAHEKYYRWHKVTADTVLSSRHPASARSS
ncbi:MAG TPA: HAD family hydrolase [Vicinamibacterales bacterium]|nr:HAD family hydrolase [Vicinamibacterales bacterium]